MVEHLFMMLFSDEEAKTLIPCKDIIIELDDYPKLLECIKTGKFFNWIENELLEQEIFLEECWIKFDCFNIQTAKRHEFSDEILHFVRQ